MVFQGAALEEAPDESEGDAAKDSDDSKYLHGPDFEQGDSEVQEDAAQDAAGGEEEAAAAQASASKLVPSFDEEDPDA